MIERALLSVSDKRGIAEFGGALAARGVEILSTGGTARALEEAGVAVTPIGDVTGAAEILDGRVKTLHPGVHAGILARPTEAHQEEIRARGIAPIDLVAVNLYPFERAVAAGADRGEAVEHIDIGGPAMVRAAAKNHERVAVVVDPEDYGLLLSELEEAGEVSEATRRALAGKAFAHTAAYDGAVAAYFARDREAGGAAPADAESPGDALPPVLNLSLERASALRYGENPHQDAAFYRVRGGSFAWGGGPGLDRAEILQGKALSYNNYLDLDAALACCLEFDEPAAAIVKHTNPCGAASDPAGPAAAYRAARETDPTSAFGGIVAVNREVDGELAAHLAETFLECVIAPSFSEPARDALAGKKNLRLLAAPEFARPRGGRALSMRAVSGGLLVQGADEGLTPAAAGRVATARRPTEEEQRGLAFAWRLVVHVKSNAVVFARGARALAIGAGQMSRIDAVRLCEMKARAPLEGAVAASDAFFPFRDGVDALADAGARAVIQPGGSKRDDEVIAAADERGVAMILTGERHFRH